MGYDHNIALDLEFTYLPRKRRKAAGLTCEIIEVGAVKMLPDGSVVSKFSQLVKPEYAPGVSGGVHWMTGIGDEDLTCASPLDVVLHDLADWIGDGRSRMVTWSGSDRRQVELECAAKGIEAGLPGRWLDIQRLYPRVMGIDRGLVKLDVAADWCGIANDKGKAHRALYDAEMTAGLFAMMASGDCESQKAAITAAMHGSTLSSSVGERCKGLSEALMSMQEENRRLCA